MSLLDVVIALVIVGLVLYIIGLIPIDPTIKKIINILVIVVMAFWLLQQLGLWHGGPDISIR